MLRFRIYFIGKTGLNYGLADHCLVSWIFVMQKKREAKSLTEIAFAVHQIDTRFIFHGQL